MFHPDPTGSLQTFLLRERRRLALRGAPPPNSGFSKVYCPRRRFRFRLRCACGRVLIALGRRLLAGTATPALTGRATIGQTRATSNGI